MLVALRPGALSFIMLCLMTVQAQTSGGKPAYISWEEALPIITALNEIAPSELKNQRSGEMPQIWSDWVRKRDADVRARLIQGDVDTMINFLLFGISFTRQPRLSSGEILRLRQGASDDELRGVFQRRVDDLLKGLVTPGQNERLLFLRKLVQQQGYSFATADERARLKEFIEINWQRVVQEQESYSKVLESARLQGGANEEFIERSKLYRERGLSLDTSLMPNFAIEESLRAMKERSLLKERSIRRVAIIGPGLDFADKAGGYDFYPEQTLQPFALMDSLLRLQLTKADQLQLTALDISPRVNSHLARLRRRADRNLPYTVQLPLPGQVNWQPEVIRYWKQFGSEIGTSAKPVSLPFDVKDLKLRAVTFRPSFAGRLTNADLNIVFQRLSQPHESFDLIIATNILVYYDVFEQSLALKNIASMLRPGGFLLSNNALLELPAAQMKSVDYLSVAYSDRQADGDHIVWYQRMVD